MLSVKVNKIIELILLFCIAVFLIDLILLGSGAWSMNIIGLSLRKIVYSVFLLIIIFTSRGEVAIITLVNSFVFCLFFGGILPILYDVNIKFSLTEAFPLFGILIAPVFATNILIIGNWRKIRNLIYFLCIISAVVHIVVWMIGLHFSIHIQTIKNVTEFIFANKNPDAIDNIIISDAPGGAFRVLFPNSLLMILGMYLAIDYFFSTKSKIHLIIGVLIFIGLYTTWTRALYLMPVILLMSLFLYKLMPVKLKISGGFYYSLSSIGVIFIIFMLPFMLHPSMLQLIGISSESSDTIRHEQIGWIYEVMSMHPFFGSGLGSSATDIRSILAPWAYEMSLLALIMKLGLVGCITYYLIEFRYVSGFYSGFFNGSRLSNKKILWLAFSFSTLIIFSTNPFMLSFPGVMIVYFITCELYLIHKEEING